jgi:uncharacterized membrane protein YidH (DUF202 family)
MNDADDPRIFFAAERSLLAWNRTCLSTLSFRAVVRSLTPRQIPSTPFANLALVANLGVAVAGLALMACLALAAQ